MMRTSHSIKNISISLLSQIVIVLLGFISRKVFIDNLGIDYLGVNGLLTNVISMMVLIEGGIAISIVYNLYKPLAENDQGKIIALVQLYKKAYAILAMIVLVICIGLYPFLDKLMKDGDSISSLTTIYFIFVAKSMISYLNAHKWSLINADQRGYVIAKYNLIFQISTTIAKIIVLILTKNYVLYLVIELLIYAVQNVWNGRIVNKRYPYIKTKVKHLLDKGTKENIMINVKAMFLHNIGGYIVFGTDNILISSLINVATVGLYSNYTMITEQVNSLVSPILGGIGASVGNLIATEGREKNYAIFKVSYLVNFWIFSFSVIFLYNLLEPFISWWLGKEYLLDKFTFLFILINFYLNGMRSAISTFKNKAGLFVQDKFAPLIEGAINLISSIILANYFGLSGIFIGTTISTISTVFWTQPCIVYKNLFKKPVRMYFMKYGYFALLTILICMITTLLINTLVSGSSFLSLIERGLICLFVPNLIYLGVFYKSQEFKYILGELLPEIMCKLNLLLKRTA